MKDQTTKMTHSELSDDVKDSFNSLIEDKAQDPNPYKWTLPPGLQFPNGSPAHRRMPRKVHQWSVLELRKWKRALDKGEVKLLTEHDLKEKTNREKTIRREKKEILRAAVVKLEAKKKNISVEVTVDSKFPRLKYQVIDESDVEVVAVKKTATPSKSSAAPLVFHRDVRAVSTKTQLDPKRNIIFPSIPQASAPRALDLDGLNKAYNLQYNFDDFFNSQPAMLLPPQASPKPDNPPATSDIRVEREALKAEFRQKVAQIFGISDPEPGCDTLTEEEWEKGVDDLAKRVQRHEVDLRGELDVLQTVCKQTHESYYRVRGVVPVPFGDSKVSESIEYVKGVFGDILYYGSGLAVEDALKAIKLRYQERLAKNEKEDDKNSCDCALAYEAEAAKVREEFQNSLTRMEGDVQRYAELCSRKTKKRDLEQNKSSLLREVESGKRASKKAEIKSLRRQVADLREQLNQNIQSALELSQKEDIMKDQMALIGRHEAKIKDQTEEIVTLRTQLKRKGLESILSIETNIKKGAARSPNLSSGTIAESQKPPQASESTIIASTTQEGSNHQPKSIQVQRNSFLVSSPPSNQPAANTTSRQKRNQKNKISGKPNLNSNVLPSGVLDVLKPKGRQRDPESRTRKRGLRRSEAKGKKA